MAGRSSWHHGWANLGNQKEPALGLIRTNGKVQLAAHHRSKERRGEKEKEGDRGLRPCENREPKKLKAKLVQLPARRKEVQVAEVDRRRLIPNKLGKRAPKRAVRVE